MGCVTLIKGNELERHAAAQRLSDDLSPQATEALIDALCDVGVGEWPGDYDAPPFTYPVAEAAAQSLAARSPQHLDKIMAQTRVSDTAAFYVARMLGQLDRPGLEPLLELCRHASPEARAQAVYSLRQQHQRFGDPRLVTQLLQMLIDPAPGVTYNAVGEVKALLREAPDSQALLKLADPHLVSALLARCEAEPQAGTYSEALDFFAADPRIFDFKVQQAAAGYARPCTLLQYEGLHLLGQAHVERLCQGQLSLPLIDLLGQLGGLAVSAAPRLLQLVDDPQRGRRAVLALLAMPSQQQAILDHLPAIYIDDPLTRDRILRLHPDREALARAVLPQLVPLARKLNNSAFQGVQKFGPLAAGEAPWLLEMARLGSPDYFRNSAVELLGEFGELALPAFPNFLTLLEYSSTRPAVLRALIKLGLVAAEFEIPLQVVKLEISAPYKAQPQELKLLEQALAAVRRQPS